MPLALAVIRRLESNCDRSLVRLEVLFQPNEPIWGGQPNPFSKDFKLEEIGFIWSQSSSTLFEQDLLNNMVPFGGEYIAMVFPLGLSKKMIRMLEAIGGFTEFFQGRVNGSEDLLDPLNQMKKLEKSSFVSEFPTALTFMVQLALLVPKVIPAGASELAMYPQEAIELFNNKNPA